jgi:tetratricopeptide (TPR) repeat protein
MKRTPRNLQVLFALLLLLIGGSPKVAAESKEFKTKVDAIKRELQLIADNKLKELQAESQDLERKNAPVEEQLRLLRRLSALQYIFDDNENSSLTDKKRIALMKNSKGSQSEIITLTLAHAYSRAHYQTDKQEADCKVTLQHLLTDVAGTDPCLRIQVLTRWIAWFPWLQSIRAQLIESLEQCKDRSKVTESLKMQGYLWASGYQYTNHILYQPPKSPQLLQKAFECSLRTKDIDSMIGIANYIVDDRWDTRADEPATDRSKMTKKDELMLALNMLKEHLGTGAGRKLIVSNRVRNEVVSYLAVADASEGKEVVEAWASLLAQVPQDPNEYPRDSGSELTLAHIAMGTIQTMLGNCDQARASYASALKEAAEMEKKCAQAPDLARWREHAMASLKQVLNQGFNEDEESDFENPIEQASELEFAYSSLEDFAWKTQIGATVGLAVIDTKQHQIESAKLKLADVSNLINKDQRGDGVGFRLHTIYLDQMAAGLSTLIGDEIAATDDPKDAAHFFQHAWDIFNKLRRPEHDFDEVNFRRGFIHPEWPPKSIPPSRGIPSADKESIVLRVLPRESQLVEDYTDFLEKHPETLNSAETLKQLEKRIAAQKERDNLLAMAKRLYVLDTEENQIANLMKTDPNAGVQKLKEIIQQRRRMEHEPYRLISSLCALGNKLDSLGQVRQAREPLNEALKLSETLDPKEEIFQANPNLYIGMAMVQSGDYKSAEESISKAITILDRDRMEVYKAADARLTLADCLVKAGQVDAAQQALDKAAKFYGSAQKDDPDYSLLARLARTKATIYLAKNAVHQAKDQVQASTDFLQHAAAENSLKSRDQIDNEILAAQCAIAEKNMDEAKQHLDKAENLNNMEPGEPKDVVVRICEIRANVAIAKGDQREAATQYQKAINWVGNRIGMDCPRIAKLKEAINRLKFTGPK